MTAPKSVIIRIKEALGMDTTSFMREWRELSDEDKQWYKDAMLAEEAATK